MGIAGLIPTDRHCKDCGEILFVGINWTEGRQSKRTYVCTPCFGSRTRKWENTHRAQHLEAHAARNRKANPRRRGYYKKRAEDARRATGVLARSYGERQPVPKDRPGYVYLITNPAWDGYVKVGAAKSLDGRLSGYLTASPHRDYRVAFAALFPDRFVAEGQFKRAMRGFRVKGTEWFQVHPEDARATLLKLQHKES